MNDDAQIAQLVRYMALHLMGNAAPEMQNDADVLANHRGLVYHARMIQALLQHRTAPQAGAAPVAGATPSHGSTTDNCLTSSTCTGCSVCAGPTSPYN